MTGRQLRRRGSQAQNLYDVVVIDCPPQLGYLTLSALTAATSVLVTVHPQMLDVMSIAMTGDLLEEISAAGARSDYSWMRYLVARFEPSDGPQNRLVAFLTGDIRGEARIVERAFGIGPSTLTGAVVMHRMWMDGSEFRW